MGLNFINGAVIKHQFPMSPAETKDVADLGMRVLTKISDPKVKTAAQEFMVSLMVRENKEKPDGGPVGKMLSKLGDSKDSGQRMMHKKILEAAGGGGDAAAAPKAEEKKPEKKEKKEK